ncbi:GTP-binding protein [Candidatus Omnitrophus magneticus]|uniref:GTP-binding protein n=1 Tax=Candidatus Omnitrophus magneticus TaxID=1609969 RepID=A0A0F0CKX1_9BACT|nr:GTP-binding protein [Candidatus Omnitrophus magneticus]
MGTLRKHKPVKLFVGLIFQNQHFADLAREELISLYGPIEEFSISFPFIQTDYYNEEFGLHLIRSFICFKNLSPAEDLWKIKIASNQIEEKFSDSGKRVINIDPGYITPAKLLLFTTKDYSHRVYIGNGIFTEVTLYFQKGSFKAWPWTYPDYAIEEVIKYFNTIRGIYMKSINDGQKIEIKE